MLTDTEHANATRPVTPETVGAALAATPGADAWQVDVLRMDETQLFLIGDRTEARRGVENTSVQIGIHNYHAPHASGGPDPALGATSLTLLPSDVADGARLRTQLRDTVTIATLTDNQAYSLPGLPADGFPTVETVDPELEGDIQAALEAAMGRLRSAVRGWSSVRLSSAELMTTRTSRAMRNSRALTGFALGTEVFLDFVLIAEDNGREAEFHAELHRRRLADLMIEGTVDAYATFARHSLNARTPATHRGPVIVSGEALANLFNPTYQPNPLVFHTSAQAVYQKVGRFQPGAVVTGEPPRGDHITLMSDGLRPWGVATAPFDGEGLPARRTVLIQDGIVRDFWADSRYASYLGIPATGTFANITVLPGSCALDTLRSAANGPVYEVVAFSAMSPDPISGDFVAEIRLGYRHDRFGTTPIKGGSLVGNVFTSLADVCLSTETYSDGRYYGPAAMRFGELSIAGE